jgi:hypothetical protein
MDVVGLRVSLSRKWHISSGKNQVNQKEKTSDFGMRLKR